MKKIHEYGYDSYGNYRYYPDPPTSRGVPAIDRYQEEMDKREAMAAVTAERAEKRYQEEKARLSKKACAEVDAQIEAASRRREEQSLNLLILC